MKSLLYTISLIFAVFGLFSQVYATNDIALPFWMIAYLFLNFKELAK
jgi:hypothetical protein